MPHVPRSQPVTAFWIVSHGLLIAAALWAGLLTVDIADSTFILYGYRHADFTVDSVHYAGDELGQPYWAMGQVAHGDQLERLSLDSFCARPQSQAALEVALHKGDVLPVLVNPYLTPMSESPRLLFDKGDALSKARFGLTGRLLLALAPLVAGVTVVLVRGACGELIRS